MPRCRGCVMLSIGRNKRARGGERVSERAGVVQSEQGGGSIGVHESGAGGVAAMSGVRAGSEPDGLPEILWTDAETGKNGGKCVEISGF